MKNNVVWARLWLSTGIFLIFKKVVSIPRSKEWVCGFQSSLWQCWVMPVWGEMLFRKVKNLKVALLVLIVGELNNLLFFFFVGCVPLCVHYFFHILHIYILRSDVFLINLNEDIYSLSFKALFVRRNANIALSIMSFLFQSCCFFIVQKF